MKIRLAMVTPYPDKNGTITGGVEGAAYTLVAGLRLVPEIEIHIIVPSNNKQASVEYRDGITIHWLKKSCLPGFISYWSTTRSEIHKKLQLINPDITHFQGAAGWTLFYKKPYVLTIHGISEKNVLYSHGFLGKIRHIVISKIELIGRKNTNNTIIINPYVLSEIGEQINGSRWDIENPVEPAFFELQRENNSLRVLFVGRITRQKNVDGLIRAFYMVIKQIPSASLHIAGAPESDSYFSCCTEYVKKQGLEHAIKFCGNVSRNELMHELTQANCLALVSFQETAPIVIEEAMAAGVPVIASNICGLPYMVDNEITGFLVNPNDEEAIVQKMLKLLTDATINKQMGTNSRTVASERFNYLKVAEKTLEVYLKIISDSHHI